MGLHANTIRGLHRAPYEIQVLAHLVRFGGDDRLSDAEKAKVERVSRFLDASDCAREILDQREGRPASKAGA